MSKIQLSRNSLEKEISVDKVVLSIIIPTHKRETTLLWHLRELAKQSLKPSLFEVIVVSDGIEFSDWLIDSISKLPSTYKLQMFAQDKAGPASARNNGAKEASGSHLLFLADAG